MTIVTCNYHYDLEKAFNGKVTHDIQKRELHVHCEEQVVIIQEPSFSPVILFTRQDGQWLFATRQNSRDTGIMSSTLLI